MSIDNEGDIEKNIEKDTDGNTCKEFEGNEKDEKLKKCSEGNGGDTTSKLEEECNELKRKFTYLYADFENYKRRVNENQSRLLFYGLKKFILDILPVLDDLERAVSYTDPATNKWLVPIVYKFTHALADNGVKKIETNKGDAYDAKIHNAAATSSVSNDENHSAEPLIKDIICNGYTLNDEVIRYVDVVV